MIAVATTNIRPLADRVLVRPLEREDRTPGGIVLPETAKEKPQLGKVLAVGPGRREDGHCIAPEVKEGDTILFSKYSGTELKVESEDLLLLSERDILSIIGG